MYLGTDITDEETGTLLQQSGLKFRQVNDIAAQVAGLLAKGEVVARCAGRMEAAGFNAEIRPDNAASIRIFEQCGFRESRAKAGSCCSGVIQANSRD